MQALHVTQPRESTKGSVAFPHGAGQRNHAIYDAVVIGGGLVGSALAYGLRDAMDRVAVLDEGDVAYRASRGNFGLVWVQGKGVGLARYGQWTLASACAWESMAEDLMSRTGIDVGLVQRGGLHVLLSDREVEARLALMRRLHAQPGMTERPWSLLDRHEVAELIPGAGPDVCGAIWTPADGAANPLKLLRAFHAGMCIRGIDYLPRRPVAAIRKMHGIFTVDTVAGPVCARQVVLAAGLGNAALARLVGLDVPVRPQRGQVIALERTAPLLGLPCSHLRQMEEGSWIIGDSQEEVGYADTEIGLAVVGTMADRALRTLPALRDVSVVRVWSALRVMSPDGFPIYEQSESCPGAFVVTCHSGVTLAAAHARMLAPMIAAGRLDDDMQPFSTQRFSHVQNA